MGRLQAEEMASRVDLDQALTWHLRYNHYPPVSTAFIEPCKRAIELASSSLGLDDGWCDELVDLPEGINLRGRDDGKAPAAELVRVLHLDGFITREDHEDPDDDEESQVLPLPSWIRIVRTSATEYERAVCRKTNDARAVASLLYERLGEEQNEVMIVVCLDGQTRVMAMTEIARGGRHGLAVTAREVYQVACAIGASAIVLAHNHPSGVPRPSSSDVEMTDAVARAGEAIGILLADHVVLAGTKYCSFQALGLPPFGSTPLSDDLPYKRIPRAVRTMGDGAEEHF